MVILILVLVLWLSDSKIEFFFVFLNNFNVNHILEKLDRIVVNVDLFLPFKFIISLCYQEGLRGIIGVLDYFMDDENLGVYYMFSFDEFESLTQYKQSVRVFERITVIKCSF